MTQRQEAGEWWPAMVPQSQQVAGTTSGQCYKQARCGNVGSQYKQFLPQLFGELGRYTKPGPLGLWTTVATNVVPVNCLGRA